MAGNKKTAAKKSAKKSAAKAEEAKAREYSVSNDQAIEIVCAVANGIVSNSPGIKASAVAERAIEVSEAIIAKLEG